MSELYTVDDSSIYTRDQLVSTLLALMNSYQPTSINTLDYTGVYGDGDHSDHLTIAYLVLAAQEQYTTPHGFAGYQGYEIHSRTANVSGQDLTQKSNAFFAYAAVRLSNVQQRGRV